MAQEVNRTDKLATPTKDGNSHSHKEQDKMFDFELKIPEYETSEMTETPEPEETWADRTCLSKRSLKRFLATLTPAQLAQAVVMEDDNNYVVFYQVLKEGNTAGLHFDEGQSCNGKKSSIRDSQQSYLADEDCGKNTISCTSTTQCKSVSSEINHDEREQAINVLLSSVKLL